MKRWHGLDGLEADSAFLEQAARAFPALAGRLATPLRRRDTLALIAAALALAGCDPSGDHRALIPPVRQPPGIEPGLVNRYASVLTGGGEAAGVVVTHRSGRPVKIEGNPNHPASLGATDMFAQAAILDLFDPARGWDIARNGEPATWNTLLAAMSDLRATFARDHGAGLRVLTGSILSPTTAGAVQSVLATWPEARWHQWDGLPRDTVLNGAVLAYGKPVAAVPRLDRVERLLALDSDLLDAAPGHLRHARDFAAARNPTRADRLLRLYAAEPTPTLTGVRADHRRAAGPQDMHRLLISLAAAVLKGERPDDPWIVTAADDLMAHRGRALVHAGPGLSAEAHALVHAVNEALGGRGRTFDLTDPPEHSPTDQGAGLRDLTDDMRAGRVRALIVLDSNPVFTTPATTGFTEALRHVPFSLTLAAAPDETASATTWFVPMAHELETWGDARAFDGTAAIAQPQTLPLWDGHSAVALLSLLCGAEPADSAAAVRATWRQLDDAQWREALRGGVVAGTQAVPLDLPLRPDTNRLAPPEPPGGPVLLVRPEPHLRDGRHAGNAWLQEAPRPLTKLAWDNPLLVSPQFATRERLVNGAVVHLSCGSAEVVAPVWIVPGQAGDVVVALAGGGRRVAGPVGTGVGTDMHPLRDQGGTFALHPTGGQTRIACTDHHNVLAVGDDPVVRHLRLDAVPPERRQSPAPTLYPPRDRGTTKAAPVQWGMSIDLNACIGCNACVIACQAENNVPVVGREEMLAEREMHWLRIDRYWRGPAEAPVTLFQPMLCQHCEQAPCEIVCPVIATMHDAEGLNVQVYNRCVGTRFCSNNCPYKVRRFNFGAYAREEPRPAEARNPDVTVRARGVMEKCTFCLQRIAAARIEADLSGQPPADGTVVTACQAACPTRAFSFGNVADPASDVSHRKAGRLTYAALDHLATAPRVTYEARVDNPNPRLGT